MNQSRYAINAYQAAQRTLPPLKVVVMLYDGIPHSHSPVLPTPPAAATTRSSSNM